MNNLDAEDDLLYTWWNREINHSLVQLKRVLCLCHRSQCNHFIKMDVFKWLNLDVCTAQSALAYQIRQKAKHTLSCDSAWGKRVHLSSIRPLRDWTQPCPVMDSHHKVGILLTRAPGCLYQSCPAFRLQVTASVSCSQWCNLKKREIRMCVEPQTKAYCKNTEAPLRHLLNLGLKQWVFNFYLLYEKTTHCIALCVIKWEHFTFILQAVCINFIWVQNTVLC